MELHHRSSVVPSNAPTFPDPDSPIPKRVLQERSGNRRQEYQDSSISLWKRKASPTENVYPHRPGGSYISSNITSQLSDEKSETQIEYETKRLLGLLERCEKYQKYRDRQIQSTKEREQQWSDTLERAFFRGLVRWPPMGRRKLMLDGQLRGRNELVADSILRDTGEVRSRKQVSSHLQVLKNILSGQPHLLMHMSTQDLSGKRQRHSSSHLSHLRNRQQPYAQHRSKDGFSTQAGINHWQGNGTLLSANVLAKVQSESDAPYTVENFTMHVQDSHKDPVHHYAQLGNPTRQQDLNVTDTTSWHKQYPELNFHRTGELKDRHVLVCDSSIKIMTEVPHKLDKLAIDFVLKSSHDLAVFEPLQSRTRFYDSGVLVDQYDEQKPEYQAETGRIFLPFGSKFWAERLYTLGKSLRDARMSEQTGIRTKAETDVRRSLQYMTAVQDIYSANRETGEQHCFLTVLWRFNQTKSSNEAGKMMWRIVNFTRPQQLQHRWIKLEEMDALEAPKVSMPMEGIHLTSAPPALYPTLSLEFHQHPYSQHPPQLDLDSLGGIMLEGMTDFSHPNSATAPSMSTDYSQQSLPSLSHSQERAMSQAHDYLQDPNDFDFNGGHINITGCLEPAINLGQYENYTQADHQSITPLIPIAGMEHLSSSNEGFGELGLDMGGAVMQNCYSTKPSWHFANLISRLEDVAEQTPHGVLNQSRHGGQEMHDHGLHGQEIASHSVLHGGPMGDGMWKLQQSAFEHAAVKEEVHGLGILEMIERDQRRDSLGGY